MKYAANLILGLTLLCSTCCFKYAYAYDKNDSLLYEKYINLARDQVLDLHIRKDFSEKALGYAKKINNMNLIMEAMSNMGYITAQEGHYAKAYIIFQEVMTLSDSSSYKTRTDFRRKAYLANVIGMMHKELGQYDKSIKHYFESLFISDSVGWITGKSTALNNIAVLYHINGNNDQAIEILLQSKSIASQMNSSSLLFDIYINLMEIYTELNNFDSAKYYGNEILQLSNNNNSLYDLAFVENAFAKLYFEQGNYDSAVASLNRSVKLSLENGYDETYFQALLCMTKVYRLRGDYTKADSIINIASNIKGNSKIPLSTSNLLKEKSTLMFLSGDYYLAYEYLLRSNELLDSIYKSWEMVKYAEINAVYDMNLQKQRNLVLEKTIDLNQLQITQQKYIIIFAVIILFVVTFLLIFIFRRRKFEKHTNMLLKERNKKIKKQEEEIQIKNEQKLKLEIDSKNRQLTTYSLSTLKQSQLFEEVSTKINELLTKHSIKKETRKNLEQVIKILHPVNSLSDWEEFRTYFEEVHPSFYSSLKKKAPTLTFHEQKICAYIRLGLTTKEIASITFRQTRSVESTRFRIRKKLGLTADQKIFDVLETL